MLPRVGPFSTMKLRSPVRMVDTDQAGFHVSGWKSVMDRHSLPNSNPSPAHALAWAAPRPARRGPLPRVALEPSVRGYHVDTRRFEREFPGKDELSMVVAACWDRSSLVGVQSPPRYPPYRPPLAPPVPPATPPILGHTCPAGVSLRAQDLPVEQGPARHAYREPVTESTAPG